MSEKKRKRTSEKGDRPAKKVALHASETVKVQLLEDDDVLGPVIASTPGLSFPSKIALKPYKTGSERRILPQGYKHKIAPYQVLLHSSDHPKLDYTAREEHDSSAESLLKHYIGVYDPHSGELKLMEAHKVTMRSTLRSEVEELRKEQEAAAQAKPLNAMKKMEALGMEFGNKKTRKALDDRTINAIGRGLPRLASPGGTIPPPPTDNVAAAVLGSMSATTAQMPTVAEQNAVMEDSKPRPKPNMDAKIPAEVYPISTLIGNEMMAAINVKDWVEATQAKVGVKLRHRYVANRIAAVVAEKDIKKLKVLRFIHVLMKFKDTLNQKSKKEASRLPQRDKLLEAMKESAPLVDAVKQKFCDKKFELTRWHVQYLTTHICAAALIVDNFETDIYDLIDDLKTNKKEVLDLFKELGTKEYTLTDRDRDRLKITKAEAISHRIMRLKIPLVFPRMRVAGAKLRR